jgi:HlyD family secretion protein
MTTSNSVTGAQAKWLPRLLTGLGLVVLAAAGTAGATLFGVPLPGGTPTPTAGGGVARAAEQPSGSRLVTNCVGRVDLRSGVVSLYPLQAGRVQSIDVREGQEVSQGDVLLRLDHTAADGKIAEAEAAVKVAETSLDKARGLRPQHEARQAQQKAMIEAAAHSLEGARAERDWKKKLVRDGYAVAEQLQSAEAQVAHAEKMKEAEEKKMDELLRQDPEQEVRGAEAELALQQTRLADARQALDDYVLKAPRAGKVLRIQVGVGEVLGSQAKQAAILFAPAEPRIVRGDLDQEFAYSVKPGQTVLIKDPIHPDQSWSGKVESVSDWYTQQRALGDDPLRARDSQTLECIITLDGDHDLHLGQRVSVEIYEPK